MENFVVYEAATGRILQTGSGPEGMTAAQIGVLPGTGVLGGEARLTLDYVDTAGPTIAARPAVPHSLPTEAPSPVTLDMAGMPAGTLVTATNEAGVSVSTNDPADPIILTGAEVYAVRIEPPFPYLPETMDVEAT